MCDPALEAIGAREFFRFFLPAEKCGAFGNCDRSEQKARVRKQWRGFRRSGEIETRANLIDGSLAELDSHFAHVGKIARHLVDAVKVGADGRARITRKHVRLQLRHESVADFLWNRAGRDRVTRPSHHRQCQQQDVPLGVVHGQPS